MGREEGREQWMESALDTGDEDIGRRGCRRATGIEYFFAYKKSCISLLLIQLPWM